MMKYLFSFLFSALSLFASAQNIPNVWGTTSHSGNAYTIYINGFGSSYTNKLGFLKFDATNTASATLAVPALGPKTLKKWDGSAWVNLAYANINTSTVYWANFNTASDWWELTPSTGTWSSYTNPFFTSFTFTGFSSNVEEGTTLSGAKSWAWSINAGSGSVSLIDIYDVTAGSALLSNTPNDGAQSQAITSVTLSTAGNTQSWKGILHDTNVVQDINSATITTTARLYIFYGPTSTAPTNSATVRALPNSVFHSGGGTLTLATGTTETTFMVCLPPGKSITNVTDTNTNADITSSYILQSSINVLNAAGTNRAYVIYKATAGSPFSPSHNHVVTFN